MPPTPDPLSPPSSRPATARSTAEHPGSGPALLEVAHLSVTYANGARGVQDVSLRVGEGEIIAVLGRNGAGKTSTLRGIGGFLRSEHTTVGGQVVFEGRELRGAGPTKTFRRGIVLVPEREKVFPALRVSEHLHLAGAHGVRPTAPCAFEPLERLRDRRAGLLSGGERQMLALEVAWRSQPRLLLVDEASLGLAPVVVKELMSRLRSMASERRTAVILVDQDASSALRVADRAYVINHGQVTWEGATNTVSAADIAREYLGTSR